MEICKWKMKLAADTKIYQIWKITNNEMDDNKNYGSEISLDVMAAVPSSSCI